MGVLRKCFAKNKQLKRFRMPYISSSNWMERKENLLLLTIRNVVVGVAFETQQCLTACNLTKVSRAVYSSTIFAIFYGKRSLKFSSSQNICFLYVRNIFFFIFRDEKYMKPYKVLFKDLQHAPTSNSVINPNINVFYFFLVIFPLWGFCFLVKDFSCFERIYFGMNESIYIQQPLWQKLWHLNQVKSYLQLKRISTYLV